jgi:hypothetical protein
MVIEAINSKDGQSCWNCSHFQRYDESSTPIAVYGDCRRVAILGYLYDTWWFDSFHPFIREGNIFWCAQWKLTNLTVPPVPMAAIPPIWPDTWFNWLYWNVKASDNISCQKCNHFQLIDPEDPEDLYGTCRKYPPEPVTVGEIGGEKDAMYGQKVWMLGPDYWCGEFEKQEVPL